jgi:rhamnogalacturonyl hydrolase YesR
MEDLQIMSRAALIFSQRHLLISVPIKKAFPGEPNAMEHFLDPQSLDDTGSMCAAMIQALQKDIAPELRSEIDNSINFIMTKVYRLTDGTFARNRPMPNSVWVDDLYQGIPALAQMGKLTGGAKYFDEATKQVELFSKRLFDRNRGVCLHGWVEGHGSSSRLFTGHVLTVGLFWLLPHYWTYSRRITPEGSPY